MHQADQLTASPPVTTLFIALLVIAAGAAIIAQLVRFLSGRPEPGREPPPLVVPIHPQFARRLDAPAREPVATAPVPVAAPLSVPVFTEPDSASTSTAVSFEPSVSLQPAASAEQVPVEPALVASPADQAAPAETVRFLRPGDEALQLLPARFEVISGLTPRQVIRFVRVPGKPAEMIIGREAASSPQQVTLTSSTVSRRHARVSYSDGRWLVSNLSRTNPVVVNDHALAEFEGPRPLLDGDRIELGDVVLRFCTS